MVLNLGPLDWESSALTTRSLLYGLRAFNKLNMCLISGILTNLCCGSDRYTVYVNVFLLYSYQMVKSKSYFTINKTEKIVTINQQNKTENTYRICLLINTDVLIIILFSREWFVVLL